MINKSKHILWLLILILPSFTVIAQSNVQFEPIPADFGINLPNALYAQNILYDNLDTKKQRFHLFLPDTSKSYPLVVFIHGGGFTGGTPDEVLNNYLIKANLKYCLEKGVAFASIGYRLINKTGSGTQDTIGVIKCLNDSKRAIQFIRYHANELKIIPEKIALTGVSAGAGTSLWLATRSDMADPNATDPVLRQSTRVCAVVLGDTQATYDLYKWETEVFKNYDGKGSTFTLKDIENALGFERGSNFYGGLDSVQQILYDAELIQYRKDVDMLYHMSTEDVPMYIISTSMAVQPGGDLLHHALHAQTVFKAAKKANISEAKALIPLFLTNTTENESYNDFLIRHLKSSSNTSGIMMKTKNSDIKVYPNPAKDFIKVLLPDFKDSELILIIYGLQGTLMLSENLRTKGNSEITINISGLSSGIYLYSISGANTI
jgi:para-nitrobenzyl esterase